MPDSSESKWRLHGVRVVHGNELDVNTAQTPGMNRAAAITNARAALGLPAGLDVLVWKYAGEPGPAPRTLADVPASTPASKALSAELKRHGFTFTGPVTAYATMQACGIVNDHLAACFCRNRG